jgi:fumarate hydratase, class II
MRNQDYRIEKDSLGEVHVPTDALYMAQTQRAVENFLSCFNGNETFCK